MTASLLDADLDRRICENINTALYRAHWSQRELAKATGLNRGTINRRMKSGGWLVNELPRLAAALRLEVHELIGDVPSYDEWASRDSNPEPAD